VRMPHWFAEDIKAKHQCNPHSRTNSATRVVSRQGTGNLIAVRQLSAPHHLPSPGTCVCVWARGPAS
jgi:hypothetical protein